MTDLNTRLLQAHQDNDKQALVDLYSEAADLADDADTRAFFLTHAYIFALEVDHPSATVLHSLLKAMDRT